MVSEEGEVIYSKQNLIKPKSDEKFDMAVDNIICQPKILKLRGRLGEDWEVAVYLHKADRDSLSEDAC